MNIKWNNIIAFFDEFKLYRRTLFASFSSSANASCSRDVSSSSQNVGDSAVKFPLWRLLFNWRDVVSRLKQNQLTMYNVPDKQELTFAVDSHYTSH